MIVSRKVLGIMLNKMKKETFFGITVGNRGQNNIVVII